MKAEAGKTYTVDGETYKAVHGGGCDRCDAAESCVRMPDCLAVMYYKRQKPNNGKTKR